MVIRDIEAQLEKYAQLDKVIVLLGPRQVGKTTLMKKYFNKAEVAKLWLDCDFEEDRNILSNVTMNRLKTLLGQTKLLCIDEAQRVKNIGLTLKILADNFKDVKVMVTGSSVFDMANEINEPLTGRKIEMLLYPFSTKELFQSNGGFKENANLETRLIYGFYPDVVNNPENAKKLLSELTSSYLYKDIFLYEEIRSSHLLENLLKALAYQIGSQVSYNELAQLSKVSSKTIERYIKLLEQAFVIFRLPSYSKNLRNELSKSQKIYFYDNGIRNALIGAFGPFNLRNDIGQLWENYLVSERLKSLNNSENKKQLYFWRTKQQQEIDLVEENDSHLNAYEFKYTNAAKAKLTKTFSNAYPNSMFEAIDKDNYLKFVGID